MRCTFTSAQNSILGVPIRAGALKVPWMIRTDVFTISVIVLAFVNVPAGDLVVLQTITRQTVTDVRAERVLALLGAATITALVNVIAGLAVCM